MKNYPNQASQFARIRGTLAVIETLINAGRNVLDDGELGYACASAGVYTFSGLTSPTPAALNARIGTERTKPPGSQGARTFARELRRTLHDMGWLDASGKITPEGQALLASKPGSIEEQSLLVEGLLKISVSDSTGTHHPVQTMLRLLATNPSLSREGLELALEPHNDSPAELNRVVKLYGQPRAARVAALGITEAQRANAVKIFPSLAVQAGLVVEIQRELSLSLDGWTVLGQSPPVAKKAIAQRPGRRTTSGKLVSTASVAKRVPTAAPAALSPAEQARARDRLRERTVDHQALVQRIEPSRRVRRLDFMSHPASGRACL